MLPIRTILHPTDFSEQARHAFATACSLARDHGARVIVLYVRAPEVVPYGKLGPIVPDPVRTPADAQAGLSGPHLPDPGVEVEYRVAEGDPAAEIIRLARELGANLIVMGTHGRTGLGRLLMGSVAAAVLRRAPCAVLTLKAPFFVGAAQPEAAAQAEAAEREQRRKGKGRAR
jgi:nucleotide-binding universal stress UspA family protein